MSPIERIRSLYLTRVVLPRMVKANRDSLSNLEFVRRREAAKKGWAMRFQRRSAALRAEPCSTVSALRAAAAIARTP